MRKLQFIVFILLVFLVASCKKEYSCTCRSGTGANEVSYTTNFGSMKKKDAKSACAAKNTKSSINGVTVSLVCNIN